MEVGGRHKGDADPLELEPADGGFLGLDFIEHDVAGVDNEDKGQQRAKGPGHLAAKVVGEEVDEQRERRQNDRRRQEPG